MKIARYLAPFSNPWAVAGESLMLPLLAVALGIWLNPLDPLWTAAGFPWAWLAPVILALRYGPFAGLAGAAVLLVAWLAFNLAGWLPGEFPKVNFLGGLILVMLCGEFSSLWVARTRRAEGVQLYLDQRLEYLTHQYYLLRLSHDRLEQDLIGRPMAMRDALGALNALIARQAGDTAAANGTGATALPGADGLLRLFAQYCQLEAAALHAVRDGVVEAQPAARIGAAPDLFDAADPLLARALENERLSHVAADLAAGENPSRYLIAAPLTTLDGRVLAVLLVERVPFFALHEEMLQTLNLLLGYYADGLSMHTLAAPLRADCPACPPEFAFELQRLWRVRRDSEVPSVLVALEFRPHPQFDGLAEQIARQRRALDVNWLIEAPTHKVLLTLMPLAGAAAAEGYLARIESLVRPKGVDSLNAAGVFAHVARVDTQPPLALLAHLFEVCDVPAEACAVRADA
ncbi:MAG: PelD GGDEF domain-containing protein [Proteobacteria bacterium]|nr:PelD GGDEF domain-containing protein [Pseudomonadota bacterium]